MIMIANLQYAWTLFVKPLQARHGLEALRHPVRVHAVHPVPDLGAAARRLADRSARAARLHQRRRRCCAASGWAGMGYATSLPMLYALYCLAGIGAAFVYSGSIGSALKWFKDRRGLASGHHGGRLRRRHGALHPVHLVDDRDRAATSTAFIATGILQGARDPRRRAVPAASAGRAPPAAKPRRRGASQLGTAPVHDAARCCARRSST